MNDHIAPSAPRFPSEWPDFGLGCAPLGDLFARMPEAVATGLLDEAWANGIRYFDTAPWYGHGLSEHRLGALLRQKPRDAYVVSTKVGRIYEPAARNNDARVNWLGGQNFAVRYDYTAEGFESSLAQSRLRLGQPVIDAAIIHDLDRSYHGEDFDRHLSDLTGSGLDYLRTLKSEGEIAAIGMGMNTLEDFTRLAGEMPVDFFLVAMPYTLLSQEALDGPMATCVARGVSVIIGAPFASGILADPDNPDASYNYAPASAEIRRKALAIRAICAAHGVPLSAAALQFPLAHPAVVSVIPGANSAEQVHRNAADFRHPIPSELWRELKAEGLIRADAPVN